MQAGRQSFRLRPASVAFGHSAVVCSRLAAQRTLTGVRLKKRKKKEKKFRLSRHEKSVERLDGDAWNLARGVDGSLDAEREGGWPAHGSLKPEIEFFEKNSIFVSLKRIQFSCL